MGALFVIQLYNIMPEWISFNPIRITSSTSIVKPKLQVIVETESLDIQNSNITLDDNSS